MKRGIFLISIFIVNLLLASSAIGQMSGGAYDIIADDFSSNFFGRGEGGTYVLYTHVSDIDTSTTTAVSGLGQVNTVEGGIFYSDELTYDISRTHVSFGSLSVTEMKMQPVTTTVTTDSITGYTIAISEDHNLQTADGNNDVADVVDGSVSAGSEEYGLGTSGDNGLYPSADKAIVASSTDIISSLGRVTNDPEVIQFKAALDRIHSRQGSYSHTVTLTVTTNP